MIFWRIGFIFVVAIEFVEGFQEPHHSEGEASEDSQDEQERRGIE
jgi:hypothetical protein